jgi:hypothetical protein
MVHCWQRHFGKVGRGAYHNKEWAARMVSVGLMASDTGEAGGKTTGQRMTHYIIDSGAFDRAAETLLATGFQLHWQSYGFNEEEGRRKAASKTKYTCPDKTPGRGRLQISCVVIATCRWRSNKERDRLIGLFMLSHIFCHASLQWY